MSDLDRWRERIQRGQADAIRRYGHLSRSDVPELVRRGKISRPMAEYLLVALKKP